MRVFDLRQPFFEEMPVVMGVGRPSIQSRQRPHRFGNVDDLISSTDCHLNTHMGTHVDAPRHMYANGKTIDQFPPEAFVGSGVVLDVQRHAQGEIRVRDLEAGGPQPEPGDIVLLHTGWAERFRSPDYAEYPSLSPEAAEWLVDRQVKLVGLDTMSPDLPPGRRPEDYPMPAHRILLGRDILIAENVASLAAIAGRRIFVSALPTQLVGADAAPAAIFAWEE